MQNYSVILHYLKDTKQLLLRFILPKPMKSSILVITFFAGLFLFNDANAQYYYKDIWNNGQLLKEFSILKKNNLRLIKLKSFEDDDTPSEGFFCEKKLNKDFTQSQMISKSYITGQSLLTSDYSTDGKLIKNTDETPTTTSSTGYMYDNNRRLSAVQIVTKGDGDSATITETHEYTYDDNGKLAKMIRKKNNVYLLTIHFKSDDKGNIIEEDVEGTNTADKKYFYYYDDKNRLTDVVHYNERASRLLPDYMYEYAGEGQPTQMISTEEGGNNYFVWKYTYNEQGLCASEKCYSKERNLLGTIEYDYK